MVSLLSEGFGGAVIDNDEVFILDRHESEFDIIKCYDLANGNTKWIHKYKSEGRFGFTRSVPAVDNKAVYTVGCMGNILCVDRHTGKNMGKKST